MILRRALCLVALLLAAARPALADTQPVAPAGLANAIDARLRAFYHAREAGDWNAVGAFFDDQAVLLPGGAGRIDSRAGIVGFFSSGYPEHLAYQRVLLSGIGNYVTDVGTYASTAVDMKQRPGVYNGGQTFVWKLEPDGTYKIFLAMWSVERV